MQKYFSRKRIRFKNYDYSLNGFYFITINSKDYLNIFGRHTVGSGFTSDLNLPPNSDLNKIKLSILGKIIDKQWNDLKNRYKFIDLDEYIIMPNHFHGILVIRDEGIKSRSDVKPDRTGFDEIDIDDGEENINPKLSVSDIICAFKSICVNEYLKYINQNNLKKSGKIWHKSFHDKIIRTQQSLEGIREYIRQNPENWKVDKYNLRNG